MLLFRLLLETLSMLFKSTALLIHCKMTSVFTFLLLLITSSVSAWDLSQDELSIKCKEPCFDVDTQWPKIYDRDLDTCATLGLYHSTGISLELQLNATSQHQVHNVSVVLEGSTCQETTLNEASKSKFGKVSLKKQAPNDNQATHCALMQQVDINEDRKQCEYTCNCSESGCAQLTLSMTQKRCRKSNTALQLCELELHYQTPFSSDSPCQEISGEHLRTVSEGDTCLAGTLQHPLFYPYCPLPGVYQCSAQEAAPTSTTTTTTTPTTTTTAGSSGINGCIDQPSGVGVYTLSWNGKSVKCNEGWTSILFTRAVDEVDFDRNFAEYETGFGSLAGTHWAGLAPTTEIMAQAEGSTKWKLRFKVVIKDTNEEISGTYNDFTLDVNDDYRLGLGSFVGDASHNVLDCSSYLPNHVQNGWPFSAKDKDLDSDANKNHAAIYKAGFWYNKPGRLRLLDYTYNNNNHRVGNYYGCSSSLSPMEFVSEMYLEMYPY